MPWKVGAIWLQIVLRHILSPSNLPFLSLIPHSNLMCGTILFAYLGSVERSFFLALPWHKMGVVGEAGEPNSWLVSGHLNVLGYFFSFCPGFFLLSLFFYIVHRNPSFPPTVSEFVLEKTTYLSNLHYFFLCTIVHLRQACFVKCNGWLVDN